MQRNFYFQTILTVASMACLVSSCNNPSSEQSKASAFDPVAARKIVEDGSAQLMLRLKNGDSTGFSNMFTLDAKVLPSGAPAVSGRDAIRSLFGGFIKAGYTNLSLITVDVWGSESFIVEEGQWKGLDPSGNEFGPGKYLKLWTQENGEWKLFREAFNSDVPPVPMK